MCFSDKGARADDDDVFNSRYDQVYKPRVRGPPGRKKGGYGARVGGAVASAVFSGDGGGGGCGGGGDGGGGGGGGGGGC